MGSISLTKHDLQISICWNSSKADWLEGVSRGWGGVGDWVGGLGGTWVGLCN